MARGKLTFRQTDIVRMIKAVRAAGVEIARVEVDAAGKIVVIPGKPAIESEPNPWDEVLHGTDQAQARQLISRSSR